MCVLLLDINLSPYGGDYMAEAIRDKYPSLPILAVTGDVDHDHMKLWQSIGFNGVICKPIDWDAVINLFDHIFAGHAMNNWIVLPPAT